MPSPKSPKFSNALIDLFSRLQSGVYRLAGAVPGSKAVSTFLTKSGERVTLVVTEGDKVLHRVLIKTPKDAASGVRKFIKSLFTKKTKAAKVGAQGARRLMRATKKVSAARKTKRRSRRRRASMGIARAFTA